jgi:hypothetical protein
MGCGEDWIGWEATPSNKHGTQRTFSDVNYDDERVPECQAGDLTGQLWLDGGIIWNPCAKMTEKEWRGWRENLLPSLWTMKRRLLSRWVCFVGFSHWRSISLVHLLHSFMYLSQKLSGTVLSVQYVKQSPYQWGRKIVNQWPSMSGYLWLCWDCEEWMHGAPGDHNGDLV